MFEILGTTERQRRGRLTTKSGEILTPVFMPIATKASVKHVLPEELRSLGAQVVLGNTYHLWLRPGSDLIDRAGGLHRFMHWDGPILTDSGGFQVFSLGARAANRFGTNGPASSAKRSFAGWVKLTEEGVEFTDPLNGNRYFLSPEKSIDIQLELGSDIIMVLDECPPYPCSHEYAKKSLELTTRWAERCRRHFEKRMGEREQDRKPDVVPSVAEESVTNGEKISRQARNDKIRRPLLFAIVQGSTYEDLRKESARQLTAMDFDGYAIGGVAVGEPREKMAEVLEWVTPLLPADKPRYLMGLGKPEEIVAAVRAGVDMFDCVIPTREGRHGRLFVWNGDMDVIPDLIRDPGMLKPASTQPALTRRGRRGEQVQHDSFYKTININNERYKEDFTPFDSQCDCYACEHYTKAYVRHLFAVAEPLAGHLASIHNVRFYLKLAELLRS
jgi:queuine tRNA-ribosyltransferase